MESNMLNNIVRMAAAGSGKTYTICREAEKELIKLRTSGNKYGKILMISYANRAVHSIETELRKANLGVIPNGIVVMSWYSFLLREMIKPYQTEIFNINEVKGLYFNSHNEINYGTKGTRKRYLTDNGSIKSEQASELVEELNKLSEGAVIHRIEDIYNHIFIDEFQDLAAYDLNIVEALMKSRVSVTAVGDGKQAIFKTNSSSKNKGKGGSNLREYFQKLNEKGLAKVENQNVSRRFNYEICNFANRIFPNQPISTCMNDSTNHDGVYLIQPQDVNAYYQYFTPIILKYDKKTKIGSYNSFNFGECKGETYDRVLIYPNGPLKHFLIKGKEIKSPIKYYIAATRARYSIAIVMDKIPANDVHYKELSLNLNNHIIKLLHLIPDKKFDAPNEIKDIANDIV